MYKDKDKQREADRERQRRYRAKRGLEAYPKGVTGRDTKGVTEGVTVTGSDTRVIPVTEQQLVKVAEQQFTEEVSKIFNVPTGRKRGKDIKCFADLPEDVKMAIDMLSKNEAERKNRTAIALNYQHIAE